MVKREPDPEIAAWLADRGAGLRISKEGGRLFWADLISLDTGAVTVARFGRGRTAFDAALDAQRKYKSLLEPKGSSPRLLGFQAVSGKRKPSSNPDAAEVEQAIQQLDGGLGNELTLSSGDAGLIVAGGAPRCMVSQYNSGGLPEMWFLAEPERGDAEEEGVIGGLPTALPARWWVSRELAILAATYYLEHSARDPSLNWEWGIVGSDE
jgi:Immunity protein Imm1